MLPFIREIRIHLHAADHIKASIQCRRKGAATGEHFQHPERRLKSAAALNGEGAMRRRDIDALKGAR